MGKKMWTVCSSHDWGLFPGESKAVEDVNLSTKVICKDYAQ